MNTKKEGHNQMSSSPSAAEMKRRFSGSRASTVDQQQITALINQSLTTSVVEPCLSPLLWSESIRLRLDG
jgi:hypothetical protein